MANSGSVGLPHDGDRRASYLLLDDGQASIGRVEYDVDIELKALRSSRRPHADRAHSGEREPTDAEDAAINLLRAGTRLLSIGRAECHSAVGCNSYLSAKVSPNGTFLMTTGWVQPHLVCWTNLKCKRQRA